MSEIGENLSVNIKIFHNLYPYTKGLTTNFYQIWICWNFYDEKYNGTKHILN